MQDQPIPTELTRAVADFLRHDILPTIGGHNAFKLRVAINALDLVTRQLTLAQDSDTAEAARQHWGNNDRVPLSVITEKRRGVAYAREAGFDAARYEYVSFIDDDNWVCEHWVARVEQVMAEHPKHLVAAMRQRQMDKAQHDKQPEQRHLHL